MKKIIILVLIIFLLYPSSGFAEEISQEDILSSQKNSINIGKFIEEAKKHTTDIFENTDYNELLNSAITGKIDNEQLGKSILNIYHHKFQQVLNHQNF